jgi:hypothetical protein
MVDLEKYIFGSNPIHLHLEKPIIPIIINLLHEERKKIFLIQKQIIFHGKNKRSFHGSDE